MTEENRLRDERRRSFYMIDNEIIDTYGPTIGVYGIAVYNVIAKYANAHGENAFPSYQTIADAINISRRKAIDTIELLVKKGLVKKSPRSKATGDATSNLYTLVDMKEISSAQYAPSNRGSSARHALPSAQHALGVVHSMHPNNTHIEQNPINNTTTTTEGAQSKLDEPTAEPPAPVDSLEEVKEVLPVKEKKQRTAKQQPTPPVPSAPPSKYYDKSKLGDDGLIPIGQGSTPVEVYYERFKPGVQKAKLDDTRAARLTAECPDLTRLRAVVEEYKLSGYQAGNVQLMIDRYNKKGNPNHGKANQSNRAGKPDDTAIIASRPDLAAYAHFK
jgi:hypothetical protein